MLKEITIYFPFYNQIEALTDNLEHYSKFEQKIRSQFILFIVDDGSRENALNIIVDKYLSKLNIILYRINIDIPWNQGEANNLAFSNIKTDYVLRTDIDHIIDENNLNKLLNSNLNLDKNFYVFQRKSICGIIKTSHPNTYIISRKNYLKVNGYNESLCGNYGDDIDFIPRIQKIIQKVELKDIEIKVFMNHYTRSLVRDTTINYNKLKNPKLSHLFLRNKEHYILQIESYINTF